MSYWDSVGRWINTLLLFIVGIVSFDTLFRLLEAQDTNIIVSVVHVLAALILVPFQGMFSEQDYVLTALMAVLGYALLVGIALTVLRSVQATRPPRQSVYERQPGYEPGYEPQRRPAAQRERNRQYQTAKPARSAGAAPSTTAPRPPERRATKRPDPAAQAPTAKPPTRNPPARRAATAQSRPDSANGRKPTSQTDGAAPRRSGSVTIGGDAAVPRRSGSAASGGDAAVPRRSDSTASGGDAAAPRRSDSTANGGDTATARPPDAKEKGPAKATTTPATRAADTTSPREATRADRDRSDD